MCVCVCVTTTTKNPPDKGKDSSDDDDDDDDDNNTNIDHRLVCYIASTRCFWEQGGGNLSGAAPRMLSCRFAFDDAPFDLGLMVSLSVQREWSG